MKTRGGTFLLIVAVAGGCANGPARDADGASGQVADQRAPMQGFRDASPADPGSADTGSVVDVGVGVDASLSSATIPFACPGAVIAEGLNHGFLASGRQRTFIADFPKNRSRPLAVVFAWHDFGDNVQQFHDALHFDPDADPDVPAIIIMPQATGLMPPVGLGWQIVQGAPGEANVDAELFETVLGCLNAQHAIDATRIYSFGYAAGAVLTNLLYARYPRLLAAIVSESGAWMNDPAQTKLVPVPLSWSWPALDPADHGNVLLTHGGSTDVAALNIMNLEQAAQATVPFLLAAQRAVVDCGHTAGHALHPDVTQGAILQYLFAHRSTDQVPPLQAALGGLPASCTLNLP